MLRSPGSRKRSGKSSLSRGPLQQSLCDNAYVIIVEETHLCHIYGVKLLRYASDILSIQLLTVVLLLFGEVIQGVS